MALGEYTVDDAVHIYHTYSVHICSSSSNNTSSNYTNHIVAPSSRRKGPTTLHTSSTYYSKYYTAARLLNPGTTSNLVRRSAEECGGGTDMHMHTYTTLSPVRLLLCELELYDNTLWPVRGKRISSTSIHSMAPRPIERTQCTLLLYLSLESSSMILSLSLSPG